MPTTKSVNFLPAVFQTETNKKFLNATLDQLITEPNIQPINGYVGRKFAPGFKGISTYVREPNAYKADYQLEPSIIYKNSSTEQIEFYTSYPDLLSKLAYYGANVSNQNDFFTSDYYSYNPRINADAYINFNQYYWVPNGPDPVPVFAGEAELERTFYVFPNRNLNTYNISGYGFNNNPDIVLTRGGNYKFEINQPGQKFYIQTEPGLDGRSNLTNLSTREVYGVTNNGLESGTVYFNVPLTTDQDAFINMPVVQTVDLATTLTYSQIQGQLLSTLKSLYNGIDGQISNLDNKFLIFTDFTTNTADWTSGAITVPVNERYGIWTIILTPSGADFIVNLVFYRSIPINNKVIVLSGIELGNTEWYTSISNILSRIPVITAPLNTLYYQDSEDAGQFGIIRLVDNDANNINVDSDILGKVNYIAPNGVEFTNGLKIVFDSSVVPTSYANRQFYIEGVGLSIRLVPVNDLIINFESSTSNYDPESHFVLYANATLNSARDQITIITNDFPDGTNVKIGSSFNSFNSTYISEQNRIFSLPYKAGQNQQGVHDDTRFSTDAVGVTLPGIVINGVSNGAYIPGDNGTIWHYDTNFINLSGRDQYGGAIAKTGEYAYTKNDFISANAWGNVSGFSGGSYTHPDGHSKIIGYAIDGYPIYGPYGYVNPDPEDTTKNVKIMTSGYYANLSLSKYRPSGITVTVTSDIVNSNILSVSTTYGINPGMKITQVNGINVATELQPYVINNSLKTAVGLPEYLGDFTVELNTVISYTSGTVLKFDFAPGTFIEDMVHQSIVPGERPSYDLDVYNGRFGKTPEFPEGTYAYFTTGEYPWIVGPALYGSRSIDVNQTLNVPDYIIINRASRDLNPWTRRNRWFHKDVLLATQRYIDKEQIILEDFRAKRPIIEFDADLQLFNFGKTAKNPIDIFDTSITQPLLQVQGQLQGLYLDGVLLAENMRVVFANDIDPRTRGIIWNIEFENLDDSGYLKIKLVEASDGIVAQFDSISVFNGKIEFNGTTKRGKSYWWNGTSWIEAQQKTSVNQPPLFDVFDTDEISLGDLTTYPSIGSDTQFFGTKLFSYKEGTGTADPYLGFPLSYRSLNNIGDIQFENNFETQTFSYHLDKVNYTKFINTGFLHKNNEDGSVTKLNVWTNTNSPTRQMQDLSFVYNGIDNGFTLDIIPSVTRVKPNFLVYVDFKPLTIADYQIFDIPVNQQYLVIKKSKLQQGSKIDVLIYSDHVSKIGYYQVPDNLNNNSQNQKIEFPTLGQMRNHIGLLSQNDLSFKGDFPGSSNLRDLYVENQGGTIVQQSAPIPYSMMFLCNDRYNFVDALFVAKDEYAKFKNKFLQLASTLSTIDQSNPVTSVDLILENINVVKNKNFPWYYSNMVPYGRDKNTITYNIFNPLQRTYEITSTYNNDVVTNTACLVYLNNTQLIYKKDYVFVINGAGVTINNSVTLSVNDTLTIVEYNNTDGNWVPETPTKLGLYPKFTPAIITDRTYNNVVQFVRGHDGSLTKLFGDYRDQFLLELEKRIYNNIKVEYNDRLVNIYDSVPGKFRNTGLSYVEYTNILSKMFSSWASGNNLNYVLNDLYQNDNAFSYNYSLSYDVIDNQQLQGSWRACYQYFYDTQTPHLTPWEMLGFSQEPDWWRSQYGPPPYTSGNSILWNDLKNGYIAQGPRQGYDTRFTRTNLLDIIPVNENGVLLPPIGLLSQKYDVNSFDNPWSLGQLGPVENAWRNSSDFPFAVQLVMALTKPAKYFAYGMNTNSYRYNVELDQYLINDTNNRLKPDDIEINGYTVNSVPQRVTGYLNWIADYQTYLGSLKLENLYNFIRGYSVQLSYKVSGFTDKSQLKVLAEQNSPGSTSNGLLVPDADLDIFLSKSPPILNPRYSAMIIEKTNDGFKVDGYDKNNPYFSIVIPEFTGSKKVVRVLNRAVDYYESFTLLTVNVPYGTILTSEQQVANIIAGYEQFLKVYGFRFDFFDENLGQIRDWVLSTKEFLFWLQQKWNVNSVITLSPVATSIKLVNAQGIIDEITNSYYGSKVLDQNYKPIDPQDLQIVRDNNIFYLLYNNPTSFIAFLDVKVVQHEHVLICNNITEFNDIIYDPVSGQRQFRLKLVGTKTGDWTGYLNPPGYVFNEKNVQSWVPNKDYLKGDLVEYKSFYYSASTNIPGADSFNFSLWLPVDKNKIKNGLLPNFAKNAGQFKNFYNVDKVNLESEFDQYALGLIGFRTRQYLTELGLDDASQVKFYQGFIKQKGSLNSINALGNISFSDSTSSISVNEEWAFRSASYGSVSTNQFVELVLNEQYTTSNPTSLQIFSNGSTQFNSLFVDNAGLYNSYQIPFSSPILLNRTKDSNYSDDIQTAGFANLEDVDFTIFDLNNIDTLDKDINNIGDQSVIWTAKDFLNSWNIYRADINNSRVISLSNALNTYIKVTTNISHGLLTDDVIFIKNLTKYQGFYKVISVDSLTSFIIDVKESVRGFSQRSENGYIGKLTSLKLIRPSDIDSVQPFKGWQSNNKVWVSEYNDDKEWAVYNKSEPWIFDSRLITTTLANNYLYGSAIKVSDNNRFAVVGLPGYNSNVGGITNYLVNFDGSLTENFTYSSLAAQTVRMGSVIETGTDYITVGAAESDSNQGYVFVYRRAADGQLIPVQVISPQGSSTGLFGTSLAMSTDDNWLYIGAPDDYKVYVYALDSSVPEQTDNLTADGGTSVFSLSFLPVNIDNLYIISATQTFVPYRDYTLSGSTLTFTSNPAAGTITVQQFKNYRYYTQIVGNAGSQFGASLSTTTDGAQTIIGEPQANVTVNSIGYTNAGAVSIYDRSVLDIIVPEDTVSGDVISSAALFQLPIAADIFSKVYLDGELQTLNIDYTLTNLNTTLTFGYVDPTLGFVTQGPGAGRLIRISLNEFKKVQSCNAEYPDNQAKFGHSVDICSNNCSLYVGAPFRSNTNVFSGSVYRFVNKGAAFGNVTASVQNPTVTSGSAIRINNFRVQFNSSSLDSVVLAINDSNIPGVTAANTNGYLNVVSTSQSATDKLRILPDTGNALTQLGIQVFGQAQVIDNPQGKAYDYFGQKVQVNLNSDTLVIGSDKAATLVDTVFDDYTTMLFSEAVEAVEAEPTTFDSDSTKFKEPIDESGAVWIYAFSPDNRNELAHPGKLNYIQQIVPRISTSIDVQSFERLGASIAVTDNILFVGAPANTRSGFNTGRVWKFTNLNNKLGWDIIRSQTAKVDIDCLIKGYTYSLIDKVIQNNYDFIDPAKGKILGIAEQEINYKVDFDPAVYNNVENTTNNTLYWSNQQVGQVWWDLSTVRYLDYEQDSIQYRKNNWGRTFPGSSIDVYEWVESSYPPNQYIENVGLGVPKYPNNEYYVVQTSVDPISNITVVKYYFWVKDKDTLSSNSSGRNLPISIIANYISNPVNSGIRFYAALRNDTISIYNTNTNTSGRDIIFHLDYKTKINSNIIHNEYALIKEKGTQTRDLPNDLINKMIDSLSGIDTFGNPVPDPTLAPQNKIGISVRPRQSMVIDKNLALENVIDYVNNLFKRIAVTQGFDLSTLESGEDYPVANSGAYDFVAENLTELSFIAIETLPLGYKVLVKQDSSIDNLWVIYVKDRESSNWQANTTYTRGEYIVYGGRAYYVNTTFTSGTSFTRQYLTVYKPLNVWNVQRVESYYTPDYWEYTDWYAEEYDFTEKPTYTIATNADLPNLTLKFGDVVKINDNGAGKWYIIKIFPTQVITVAIQDGTIQFKNSLYDLADYGMGFGADTFDDNRFDQNPALETRQILSALKNQILINELDTEFANLFYVLIYYVFDEQKFVDWAFKSSFITATQNINAFTQPQLYNNNPQEYYRSYIEEVKPYSTTIREFIPNYQGSDNFTGYVTDFDVPPIFDLVLGINRSPSGEFVQDARYLRLPQYRDWLFNYGYYIESIEIVENGSGYTLPPVVTITGSSNNNNALARAYVTDGVVSRIDLIYPGSNYLTNPIISLSGGNGTGAIARANLANDYIRKLKTTIKYDRYTYSTSVLEWLPNTEYALGQIVNYNNKAYIINKINYISGSTFSLSGLSEYSVDKFLNANDRIQAYYQPETGLPGKDFGLLESGIDYPGVQVQGPLYSDSGGFDQGGFDSIPYDPFQLDEDGTYVISDDLLDTKITSSYLDTTLGTKPEDIIVDGGPYVYDYFTNWSANTYYDKGDLVSYANLVYYTVNAHVTSNTFTTNNFTIYNVGPYASHAPEELLPGRVYDTLEMSVYTIATDPTSASYLDWSYYQGIGVDYIQVIDPGFGFDANSVFVVIEGGGAPYPAEAQVVLNSNGSAVSFDVTYSGAGYTSQPEVKVFGSNITPIIATATMKLLNAPSSSDPYPKLAYKIYKDMNDVVTYLRIDGSSSTTLTQNLSITDTTIHVANARVLATPAIAGAQPGVVWINGERIAYNYKNDTTNILGQLRRGTGGTGARNHYAGNILFDGSQSQIILQSSDYSYTPAVNVSNITISYTGNITTDGNTASIIGINTLFELEFNSGNKIYDLYGTLIGTIANVTSNTSANLTANALLTNSNYPFAGFGTFYVGNTYIRSNIWNTKGFGVLSTESDLDIVTESNIILETDNLSAQFQDLFNSNSIQVSFLKQGLTP